jgi:hypothetical protein
METIVLAHGNGLFCRISLDMEVLASEVVQAHNFCHEFGYMSVVHDANNLISRGLMTVTGFGTAYEIISQINASDDEFSLTTSRLCTSLEVSGDTQDALFILFDGFDTSSLPHRPKLSSGVNDVTLGGGIFALATLLKSNDTQEAIAKEVVEFHRIGTIGFDAIGDVIEKANYYVSEMQMTVAEAVKEAIVDNY